MDRGRVFLERIGYRASIGKRSLDKIHLFGRALVSFDVTLDDTDVGPWMPFTVWYYGRAWQASTTVST